VDADPGDRAADEAGHHAAREAERRDDRGLAGEAEILQARRANHPEQDQIVDVDEVPERGDELYAL
jgi:hypothetical protein